MTLNETPSAERLHIGFFGKSNSGKSSIINSFIGQNVSIVSDIKGTTTDLVYKAVEINPLGPCVLIDTAGFDDDSKLGNMRIEKTNLAAQKTDIAIITISVEDYKDIDNFIFKLHCPLENSWYTIFKERKTPIIFVVNKSDIDDNKSKLIAGLIKEQTNEDVICVSAKTGEGIDNIKKALIKAMPENFGEEYITGNLVKDGDCVLLVMPQDIQAPKGRLILPQVQTIRELLDRKCLVLSVTTDKMNDMLSKLKEPPELIITDSQVFDYVYKNKPKESRLTSFSVLFAAYKGDIKYYVKGAVKIGYLNEDSKVLIAECCSHAPMDEDIGRVKLPGLLRKKAGQGLTVDVVSGADFPDNPTGYDLIIQCGACMFNRKYVLSRIDIAKEYNVPMTNYGIAIAYLTGILDKISGIE